MVIVGWGSVLLGGCPLRQLILAGRGNGDSAVTVFGMIVGAAFAPTTSVWPATPTRRERGQGRIVVGGISNNGKSSRVSGYPHHAGCVPVEYAQGCQGAC